MKSFSERFPGEEEKKHLAAALLEEAVDESVHNAAMEGRRADGRDFEEIRNLFVKAGGISETLHGSGIFYRGGTHILSALTLGGPEDTQLIDGIEVKTEKRFMHHYNFPPFSSGEIKRLTTNRREIGHGALAEKALRAVLPPKESFPYTIRVVSESMASNGSTSMASVCAGSVALMDGGVPIKNPVAGIAMGLMMSLDYARDKKYKILTDIQGPEDHYGDMDFKIAGTKDGITAIQLDIKVDGIPIPILSEAIAGAKKARLKILEKISEEISAPRPELSLYAPRVLKTTINEEKIGLLIGPGGKTIKKITADSGAENISVEDSGEVTVVGKKESAEKALKVVEDLTRDYLPGDMFQGKVTRLFEFGAMVEIGPGAEGLVHISEIAPFRIAKVTDVLKEGDIVPVVVKEIDERKRLNLSIKAADSEFASKKGAKPGSGNGQPGK